MRWFADTFGLSGWLFADLLVALALLFTAAGGFGASVGPGPSPPPSGSRTPTPPPTRDAVALKSSCWVVAVPMLVDAWRGSLTDEQLAQARSALETGTSGLRSNALLVLTFAGGVDGQASHASAVAMQTNDLLRRLPRFQYAERRSYVNLRGADTIGLVWVEVFTAASDGPVSGTSSDCPT